MTRDFGLVTLSPRVPYRELPPVAAALSKQLQRDFAPEWDATGSVTAFTDVASMPRGHIPLVIRDMGREEYEGYHADENNQPYALIQADSTWSITASHEMLETAADPWGNALVAALSVMPEQGQVLYLQEPADPVEDNTYVIGGVHVSDFVTKRYYQTAVQDGERYSFLGTLRGPRTLDRGGYLTWLHQPSGLWWMADRFGEEIKFTQIEPSRAGALRAQIDRLTAPITPFRVPRQNPLRR